VEIDLIALALLLLALALAGVGVAGRTERLPRNRWIGLRTAAVRADEESWRIGHHAASGALIVAAGPPLLLAAALVAAPPEALEDWLLVFAVVGVVTGGLIALASRQAQNALSAPDDEPQEPR